MRDHWIIWVQFALCVASIGWAGSVLSRCGDAIASHTGLSRNWVGLVLVATVTSLPELVTGIGAITIANAPDLAAGDALGSCVFNLTILALVDMMRPKAPLFATVSGTHTMSAGMGVGLLSVAALAIVLTPLGYVPTLGHVSVACIVLAVLYLMGMRTLYLVASQGLATPGRLDATDLNHPPGEQTPSYSRLSLKQALTGYGLSAAAIIGLGTALPLIGVRLAEAMGWTDSFVGTLFVALATSVPELATTWGAVRIGALDLAFGNLLGSNLFDLLILAIDDAADQGGSLYSRLSPVHLVSILIAIAMNASVIVALINRPTRRVWRVASGTSLLLLGLYVLNLVVQYRYGR